MESVLRSVLEAARDLTGARYAALGILDSQKGNLDRFLYLGIDDDARRRIGPLPRGRGVLGELIRNPVPLRLARVGEHPRSYGFPANHPPMSSFVGVPVTVRGEAFGNLYLTDKEDADEFDERDEHLLTVLADWAAVAIENARLYEEADRSRSELERAVQGLEATASLSRLGAPQASLEWLLETIAKRGRALVESRWFLVLRPVEEDQLVVTEVAGDAPSDLQGTSLPGYAALLRDLLGEDSARRLPASEPLPPALGIRDEPAMLAVMDNRGRPEGFLIAVAPLDRRDYGADDELLLDSFASSAAGALTTVTEVEQDRLQLTIQSSERERRRWARELHDETLQQLGAMKLMHESALKSNDPDALRSAVERAAAEFDNAIESLERLITELRPAVLDELGTGAALEALTDKVSATSDLEVEVEIDLAFEREREPARYPPELETTIYRIVQEGLNNVIKHAEANRVSISVAEIDGRVELVVADDGKGIAGAEANDRFGLRGLRERVELVGGELEIKSSPEEGTSLRAILPATLRDGRP